MPAKFIGFCRTEIVSLSIPLILCVYAGSGIRIPIRPGLYLCRIEYLREHIKALKEAVEIDHVDLMGYCPWGCIDLVSAGTGEMHNPKGEFCGYED